MARLALVSHECKTLKIEECKLQISNCFSTSVRSNLQLLRGGPGWKLAAGGALRTLDHFQFSAAAAVLNFVHDVVDQKDAAAGRFEEISGIGRIRYVVHIEALTFVFHGEDGFAAGQFRRHPEKLSRIVPVTVPYGVDERFIQSDIK